MLRRHPRHYALNSGWLLNISLTDAFGLMVAFLLLCFVKWLVVNAF